YRPHERLPGRVPASAGMTVMRSGARLAESCLLRPNLRVGVADQRGVAGARAGVELGQQHVVERARLAFRHRAVAVVFVTENDRLRRAGLLAGSDDLAVADRAILAVGGDLRLANALQAVGAFLHDAAAADRH